MFENWHWIYMWGILVVANYMFWIIKSIVKQKRNFRSWRYNLKGNFMWCLNWRNGWIRIYNHHIRWNTDWTPNYTYFVFEQIRRKKVSL